MLIQGVNVFVKSDANQSSPLSSPSSFSSSTNTQSRIIYYLGTFNPPHKGHQAAVKKAAEVMKASCVIVVVADNPHKTEKMSVVHRYQLLNETFAEDKNVYISQDDKDTVLQKLQKNCHLILLIGSDALFHYQQKQSLPYSELCVVKRADYACATIDELCGKKVTFATPELEDCSSTKIRNYLKLHPELFFRPESAKDSDLSSMLNPAATNYILHNRLYVPELTEMSAEMVASLSKQLPNPLCKVVCLNALHKGGNHSGDLVFRVSSPQDEAIICFIKAFVNQQEAWRMPAEIRALKVLSNIKFNGLLFPQLLWSKQEKKWGHIGLTTIQGTDMSVIWKEAAENKRDKKSAVTELEKMNYCVGQALKALHRVRQENATKGSFEPWFVLHSEKLKKNLDKLKPHLSPEIHAELLMLNEKYTQQIQADPGKHSYQHGDPNPGNFFVNLTSGEVGAVDLSDCGKAIADDGAPIGYAAFDIARVLSYTFLYELNNPLGHEVMESMCKHFLEGYGDQTLSSKGQRNFIHYFWNIRKLLNCYELNNEYSLQKVDYCMKLIKTMEV